MINLEEEYLNDIKKILKDIVPDYEVLVFGSRVNGKSWKYSDLDLAIKGENPVDFRIIEKLKDALSESNLPIMVDVIDWNNISEEFKKVIEKGYEVIQEAI
jgi:uncharacterized protein